MRLAAPAAGKKPSLGRLAGWAERATSKRQRGLVPGARRQMHTTKRLASHPSFAAEAGAEGRAGRGRMGWGGVG